MSDDKLPTLREIKENVLNNLRRDLCRYITADRHYALLRSKKVLSREDEESIENGMTSQARNGKFLDRLSQSDIGFDALCEALLEDGTQMFLLRQLNMALEKEMYRTGHLSNGDAIEEMPSAALPEPSDTTPD